MVAVVIILSLLLVFHLELAENSVIPVIGEDSENVVKNLHQSAISYHPSRLVRRSAGDDDADNNDVFGDSSYQSSLYRRRKILPTFIRG